MEAARLVGGCTIAPEKSFAGVLSPKEFFEVRSRLKELKLYNWFCLDGGWNEEETKEFYCSLSLVDAAEQVITWACNDTTFIFRAQDISLAIGVPSSARTLEEIKAETRSADLSMRLLGYDAQEKLNLKRPPMHAAIFARAAQTNLLPVLNPKTAMRRHALLLLEAVDSNATEVSFDIPKVIFREMIKVLKGLHLGKRPYVLGYPMTIRRLLALKGVPLREPDRHIQCYGFDSLYPVDSVAALKSAIYSSQRKRNPQLDSKMEEVLGEVQSLKESVSDIRQKIEVTNETCEKPHAYESAFVDGQAKPPSPIRAKTGPYPPCTEDIVMDIVQKKLLGGCVMVRLFPELSLTSRDLFCLAGDGWQSWISDTIVDSYINYMCRTIERSQNVKICNSQFLSLLVTHFSCPPSMNDKNSENEDYIDLEQEGENSESLPKNEKKVNKRGASSSRKKTKNAFTQVDDKLFCPVIAHFRKKINLFEPLAQIDSLLLPFCDGNHRYLLQIYGKEGNGCLLNSDVNIKLGANVCSLIQRWWRCDNLHTGVKAKKLSFPSPTDIPQQENPHDCGVYVLKYIECILLGREFNFTAQDIADFRRTIFKNLLNYPLADQFWRSW